jgi:hypothetical protein
MLSVPGKMKFLNPFVINPYNKALTDAATDLFTVTLADKDMVGGILWGVIRATDGTDMQADVITTTWSAVRKGATTTVAHTYVAANEAKSVSTGTLTLTATAVDSGSGVATFRITPTGSLTETTYDFNFVVLPFRGVVVPASGVVALAAFDPR